MYDKELDIQELLICMENAPANIFIKDTQCKYRFVTEICGMVNGEKNHSIIGKTDLEVMKDKILGRKYYEDDLEILASGKSSTLISEVDLGNGILYYEIKKNPVIHDGKIVGIIGIVEEITERIHLREKLQKLSFRDELTGLYNRNYMESRKHKYVRDDDYPASIIMADCNYLKEINDTRGHELGDLLLKRVSEVIRQTIPKNCVAMRVGGDEFLILCPRHSKEDAGNLMQKIRENFIDGSDDILKLDVALGSYTAEDDTLPFQEVFHLADQAMYENKKKMKLNR